MIDLLDTAPHIPNELHVSASEIAIAERSMFLTEGYLFLALVSAETPAGQALVQAGIDRDSVAEILRWRIPRSTEDPPPAMMRVSPGYGKIESRAQGISLIGRRAIDEVDVLLALFWDPCNDVAWVLHDLGRSRDSFQGMITDLRPEFNGLEWPRSEVIELELVGSVARSEFVKLAPELRSVLGAGAVWQPITRDDDTMEIWVDKASVSPNVKRVISARSAR